MNVDLLPGADEEEIARAAADYLAGELPVTRCHQSGADIFDPSKRSEIAGLGWFGLSLSEAHGGVGLSAVEEIMLFREAGRYLAPLSLITNALAAHVAAGQDDTALLSSVLNGEAQVALATVEPGNDALLRLFDWKGASLVLHVESDRAALHSFSEGMVAPVDCLDKTISMGTVPAASLTMLVERKDARPMQMAMLNMAAMLLGLAEAELDMIVAYAKIRHTFGRPIGAYQAVRHPCADMAVRCEAARAQLYAAAVSLRDGHSDAAAQVAAAKLLANTAAVKNADSNIQLHGGIAVTMEHDAHLYMKRAHLLSRLLGSDRVLLDDMIDAKLAA